MTTAARTLITANAGCGKTFTLANRVIGWMVDHMRTTGDIGVGGLLAATFTRKAAGEILERILEHLAQAITDADARKRFEETISLQPAATAAECAAVLDALAGQMHAMQVGTLDALFHRVAAVCAGEIGLPAGWTIGSAADIQMLRLQAIDDLLDSATQQHIDAIVMAAEEDLLRGGAIDAVYKAVLTNGVLDQWRGSRGPGARDAWRWLLDQPDEVLVTGACRLSGEAIEQASGTLESAEVPLTKKGSPSANWTKACRVVADHARAGAWPSVLKSTLVRSAMTGRTYHKAAAPSSLVDAVRPLAGHACAVLAASIKARMQSWLLLLGGLDRTLARRQHESGLYDFSDIALHLARASVFDGVTDQWLEFRLDTSLRDIAIDEFQDTSVDQFTVLEPIFRELFAGAGAHDEGRRLLVVADEKQSIYGWRGSTPDVLQELRDMGTPSLYEDVLACSYRSAPPLMSFVNSVFGDLSSNSVLHAAEEVPVDAVLLEQADLGAVVSDDGPVAAALARWTFTKHESAEQNKDMTGGVQVFMPAWVGTGQEAASLEMAVDIAESRIAYTQSIGILVPTNKQVATIAAGLRARGVDASEEGAGALSNLSAVDTFYSMLHWVEHPGDREAAYTVSHSALGPLIGLAPLESIGRMQQPVVLAEVSRRFRQRVQHHGLDTVLGELAEAVRLDCDQRNASALQHIVHLAADWTPCGDSQVLRLTDFVRFVKASKVGAASAGQVRVMTVHKAKGLEFDEVILPVLHPSLINERAGCRVLREGPLAEVLAVAPSVNADVRWAAPLLEVFRHQMLTREFADRLSTLYVAITRAKRGLHLVMQHHGKDIEDQCSAANIIRAAMPSIDQAIKDRGQSEAGLVWPSTPEAWTTEVVALPPEVPTPMSPRIKASGRDVHASTSTTLSIEVTSGRPRRDGIALHECFSEIEWLDDGPPDVTKLEAAFTRASVQTGRPVGSDQRAALVKRLERALAGDVGAALRRETYAHWAVDELQVLRELPLLSGTSTMRLDRLVLGLRQGQVVRAAILDFKSGITDANVAHDIYAPQLAAYVERVSDTFSSLPDDAIETRLLLVDA